MVGICFRGSLDIMMIISVGFRECAGSDDPGGIV